MANPPAVLMVELVMSIDRMIQSAQQTREQRDNSEFLEQWPPQVVLGHVSQVDEQVWIPRIAQMREAHDSGRTPPSFVWWEPDFKVTLERYKDLSLDDASAVAMSMRTQLLTAVKELTPEQWGAKAVHDAFGEIDISGLLIQILTHDEEHRASLI